MCTYRTRWGTPCPYPAAQDALVCAAHSAINNKTNLANLRKSAAALGPLVLEALEDILLTGEPLEKIAASKVWVEITGMKDSLPVGEGESTTTITEVRRVVVHVKAERTFEPESEDVVHAKRTH